MVICVRTIHFSNQRSNLNAYLITSFKVTEKNCAVKNKKDLKLVCQPTSNDKLHIAPILLSYYTAPRIKAPHIRQDKTMHPAVWGVAVVVALILAAIVADFFLFMSSVNNYEHKLWPKRFRLVQGSELPKIPHRVLICALARNVGASIEKCARRLELVGETWLEYKILVFENDSTDGTREALRAWQTRNPRVSLLECGKDAPQCKFRHEEGYALEASNRRRTRMVQMAKYRNRYLEAAEQEHERFTHVLVADFDGKGSVDRDGMRAVMERADDFDCVACNGLMHLPPFYSTPTTYDAMAFLAIEKPLDVQFRWTEQERFIYMQKWLFSLRATLRLKLYSDSASTKRLLLHSKVCRARLQQTQLQRTGLQRTRLRKHEEFTAKNATIDLSKKDEEEEDKEEEAKTHYAQDDCAQKQGKDDAKGTLLVPVLSSFNGLAIYRRSAIHGLRYESVADDIVGCEHCGLHLAMASAGHGRIFLAPDFVVNMGQQGSLNRWSYLMPL